MMVIYGESEVPQMRVAMDTEDGQSGPMSKQKMSLTILGPAKDSNDTGGGDTASWVEAAYHAK